MIVYVESNFTLELAFLRPQSDSCEALAKLAKSGAIQLVVPAFCGSEPYESMVRRSKDRQIVHDRLATEISELSRSAPYSDITNTAEPIITILAQSADDEKSRLDNTLLRLMKLARVIPLTSDVLTLSLTYQIRFGLSPQDAIVLASIMADLESVEHGLEKLFVTQNKSDFFDPDILKLMSAHGCKVLFRFDNAVGYVESIIKHDRVDQSR